MWNPSGTVVQSRAVEVVGITEAVTEIVRS